MNKTNKVNKATRENKEFLMKTLFEHVDNHTLEMEKGPSRPGYEEFIITTLGVTKDTFLFRRKFDARRNVTVATLVHPANSKILVSLHHDKHQQTWGFEIPAYVETLMNSGILKMSDVIMGVATLDSMANKLILESNAVAE